MVVPFESVDDNLVCDIQMKAIEQYFQVLTMLQNEINLFSSVLNLALLGVKGLRTGKH